MSVDGNVWFWFRWFLQTLVFVQGITCHLTLSVFPIWRVLSSLRHLVVQSFNNIKIIVSPRWPCALISCLYAYIHSSLYFLDTFHTNQTIQYIHSLHRIIVTRSQNTQTGPTVLTVRLQWSLTQPPFLI